jgi:hypothetical protein
MQSTQQEAARETTQVSVNKRVDIEDNLVNVGRFSLPTEAAALLQRAFEAMKKEQNKKSTQQEGAAVAADGKGKAEMKPEPVDHVPKAMTGSDIPKSSKNAARKESSVKVPYCFYCKTKGHAIEECHAARYCDICESQDHVKPRCPKFRAIKGSVVPCRYAVAGLGFFHVTHEES